VTLSLILNLNPNSLLLFENAIIKQTILTFPNIFVILPFSPTPINLYFTNHYLFLTYSTIIDSLYDLGGIKNFPFTDYATSFFLDQPNLFT
jgi:hypothetical protein